MTIASYLNLKYQFGDEHEYFGENIADYFAILISFSIGVLFPIAMIYVAFVPREWLLRPEFKQKWGFLYGSIKTENFMQRAYFFMFILRRAILIYTSFMLYNYPSL